MLKISKYKYNIVIMRNIKFIILNMILYHTNPLITKLSSNTLLNNPPRRLKKKWYRNLLQYVCKLSVRCTIPGNISQN